MTTDALQQIAIALEAIEKRLARLEAQETLTRADIIGSILTDANLEVLVDLDGNVLTGGW